MSIGEHDFRWRELRERRRHRLTRLGQDSYQLLGVLPVAIGEYRVRLSRGAGATGAADAVHVILKVIRRQLVVDHALDTLDVEPSR